MQRSTLDRLLALVPPPSVPVNARGDRAAAREAAGWSVPDHVLEVIEAYGAVGWLDWLRLPSPYSADDREDLANNAFAIEGDSEGVPSLVAYTDPEDAWIFVGADGFTSVKSSKGVVHTGLPLADVLLRWLEGAESFGLGPPDVPGGHPPFAIPLLDLARESRVTWLMVEPGRAPWRERWGALIASLGATVPMSTESTSAAVWVPGLELRLSASSAVHPGGHEQLSLHHYVDRQEDVKTALTAALATTGMTLARVEGPRGRAAWWGLP